MMRLPALALLISVLGPTLLRADSFSMELTAKSAKGQTAEAKFPVAAKKPRAVLDAAVRVPITVKWSLRNTDSKETVKDILVHFFVVKIDKADQQQVPKLNKNVIVESALTMDFRPQDKNEGEIIFTVADPGVYLMRLEIKGKALKPGVEPFAAMDVVVR